LADDREYLAYRSELEAHENRKDNPHGVTKSQVGLENVPNVATNDQTPTYTASSANANLASGEKMSTAFGKIAKAISSLISHLANTSNPHSVTKTQVGLGSVDNTADSAKPVSTAQATAIADAKKAGTDAQSNIDAHLEDTANPHGVTKSQVGLGNVPNVATNDQTPTYTAASSLTALSSGEKMSVAFGKVSKAVSDLISHIANKSNPHGVTAAQVGAALSSHNHAAGDITSGTLPVARGGTGVTSNPSMLVNLASTSAASAFAASPRPGVTGVLPVTNGGTGATTAANALKNLGITYGTSGLTAGTSALTTGAIYLQYE